MSLNVNRIKITVLLSAAFFICCSMSTKCNIPGPETRVHGVVTDGVTGKAIGDLPMEVAAEGEDPHYFSTNADGSYDIKFKPERFVKYQLSVTFSVAESYFLPQFIKITQGTDTVINYALYPLINVSVHLVNHTSHGQAGFILNMLDSLKDVYPGDVLLQLPSFKPTIDTVAKFQMAHFTTVSCLSIFYDSKGQDIVEYNQRIKLGGRDTTIAINNP